MNITLTTKQIMAMADFAGLKVEPHGLDIDDETEYTIEPRRDKETGRVHVFYCTEYVLLMLIQGSAVPVSEQIYTQQECERRAMQIMQVRDVEIICGEVFR